MVPVLRMLIFMMSVVMSFQGQQNQPAGRKVIKDQAEYNAYMAALNTSDSAAQAAAFDAFVNQYPESVVKVDAYEQAMAAYQRTGNKAKVESTARTLLGMNPGNTRALAIVAFLDRFKATQGDTTALKEACAYEQKGIETLPTWPRPDGLTETDFDKLRNQMSEIFEGVAGFCALQAKDYPAARSHYLKSFQIDPANMQDLYQLGIACSLMNPVDVSGFWYLAKAINLAGAQKNDRAAQGITTYAKAKYQQYHGSDKGWDEFVAAVAKQTAPPTQISDILKPRPSDCDTAAQAVAQNKLEELSFSDWEFILAQRSCGPQGKDAAEKVWALIRKKEQEGRARLEFTVKVVSATRDMIYGAITDSNQETNKADLQVALGKPMLDALAPGTTIKIIGVITDYTSNPFMFVMNQGEVAEIGAPSPVLSSVPSSLSEEQTPKGTWVPLSSGEVADLKAEEDAGETAEQAGQSRQAVQHYITALQGLPKSAPPDIDQELRERIIKVVLQLSPPPAIPEEARRHSVFAATALKLAENDPRQLDNALGEWQEVLRIAPWWANGYFNTGLILERKRRFAEAMRCLKLYLLAAPSAADSDAVQQKIYSLEYLARQEVTH